MEFNRKIHPDFYQKGVLVSAKGKQTFNIQMIHKLQSLLTDILERKSYLEKFWYSLKYIVHCIHALYKLFYKILQVYGIPGMASGCKYHHLVHGPRKIRDNMEILNNIIAFIDIQLGMIYSLLKFSLKVKFQDQVSRLLCRASDFLVNIMQYEMSWSEYTRNGLPISFN